jgi:ubiquitin-conjugating enzyme E2 J2
MALTRLRREYSNIQSEKIPHIVARPTESNLLVWHYVLHDLPHETAYCGGVYWGKLVFPREYPLKPPAIYMLTPSGRFETNTRLCLSMSDFHPESWNPSWRIESILIGLVSFMLDTAEPRTTGGVHTTSKKRRSLAKAAFDFNVASAEFRDLFPEFSEESRRHSSGRYFLETPPAKFDLCDGGSVEQRDGSNDVGQEKAPRQQPRARGFPMIIALSTAVVFAACGVFLVSRSEVVR